MTSTPLSAEAPGAMRATGLGTALASLRLGVSRTAAAWPVLAGRCVFYVLIMIVLSALWDKVAAERIAGALRLPGDLAFYVGVTEWITLSLPSLHLRLEDEIRGGGLEPHLLRPKSFLPMAFTQAYGEGLVRMVALGLTGLALLAISGRDAPSLPVLGYLLVLGPLGLAIGMLLYALAGLSAFWARRTLPFQLVIQKFMFLLGGLFAPVSLYPHGLREFAEGGPFASHLYWAAAQTLQPSWPVFLRGLAQDLVWLAVLSGLCAALWSAGLRRVVTRGAP